MPNVVSVVSNLLLKYIFFGGKSYKTVTTKSKKNVFLKRIGKLPTTLTTLIEKSRNIGEKGVVSIFVIAYYTLLHFSFCAI